MTFLKIEDKKDDIKQVMFYNEPKMTIPMFFKIVVKRADYLRAAHQTRSANSKKERI